MSNIGIDIKEPVPELAPLTGKFPVTLVLDEERASNLYALLMKADVLVRWELPDQYEWLHGVVMDITDDIDKQAGFETVEEPEECNQNE